MKRQNMKMAEFKNCKKRFKTGKTESEKKARWVRNNTQWCMMLWENNQ